MSTKKKQCTCVDVSTGRRCQRRGASKGEVYICEAHKDEMRNSLIPKNNPHIAYDRARADFEDYWATWPDHLRNDQRYRIVALQSFLSARGFNLEGTRFQPHKRCNPGELR